jgi:S1-C subfamily serine protease
LRTKVKAGLQSGAGRRAERLGRFPRPFVLDDGIRSYRDVSVITEHDAFPDRFLKITASVCFGDSGGPLFHNGTVVALNTWTFSTRCTGPNLEYRTDSAAAQRFLAANL